MSYIRILFLSLFICLVSCFCGCTKRDKLTSNTMALLIEPANDISCSVGNICRLKSIIRNSGKEEVDESVSWSVSPSELGKFEFISSSSRTVDFLAKQSGKGKIYLSCQGVVASVDITVSC